MQLLLKQERLLLNRTFSTEPAFNRHQLRCPRKTHRWQCSSTVNRAAVGRVMPRSILKSFACCTMLTNI